MANTKNDVAQQATRWFLTEVGGRYDDVRGLARFRPTPQQWRGVLEFFGHACAYCSLPIADAPILKDHLIPLNRESGGLHAWGNVIPSCRPCNNAKASGEWRAWLASTSADRFEERTARIDSFRVMYRYAPNAQFTAEAQALYQMMIDRAETAVREHLTTAEAKIAALAAVSLPAR